MLGSKFVKFLMSILKQQVNCSSIFVSFFIFMTHNSSVNFKRIHFLLWTKGSNESSNSDTFKSSAENLPNFSCHFSSLFFFKFCITFQCHKRQLLCTFLAQAICTLLKKSTLKWRFLRFSTAWVKIHQISYVNFETTSLFLFKFCIILHCYDI